MRVGLVRKDRDVEHRELTGCTRRHRVRDRACFAGEGLRQLKLVANRRGYVRRRLALCDDRRAHSQGT